MPDLIISLTDAQAARAMPAFAGETAPDGSPLTAQQAARRFLTQQLRERVLAYEASKIDVEQNADKRARLESIKGELPNA